VGKILGVESESKVQVFWGVGESIKSAGGGKGKIALEEFFLVLWR
jgi:hypothetical protein